jgi:hypothetical protein
MSAAAGTFARMAGPADQARQLAEQRIVQLAKLHWALRSHATRVEVAMRWLGAVEVPSHAEPGSQRGAVHPGSAPDPARIPAQGTAAAIHEQFVLPAVGPASPDSPMRRLRVVVSESREVSLEVEDKIPAPTPETGTRYRLAS